MAYGKAGSGRRCPGVWWGSTVPAKENQVNDPNDGLRWRRSGPVPEKSMNVPQRGDNRNSFSSVETDVPLCPCLQGELFPSPGLSFLSLPRQLWRSRRQPSGRGGCKNVGLGKQRRSQPQPLHTAGFKAAAGQGGGGKNLNFR